jgi:hypothetical protein
MMSRRLVAAAAIVAAFLIAAPATASAHDLYWYELGQTAGSDGHYVVAVKWPDPSWWECDPGMQCGQAFGFWPVTCTWSDGSVDNCEAVIAWWDEGGGFWWGPNYNWYAPQTWVVPATCTWEQVPAPWGVTYEQTCPLVPEDEVYTWVSANGSP